MKVVIQYCVLRSKLFQRNYYYLYLYLDEAKPAFNVSLVRKKSIQMNRNNIAYKNSKIE